MNLDLARRYRHSFTTDVADTLDDLGIDGVAVGLPSIYQGAILCGPAVTLRQVKATARGLNLNRVIDIIEDVAKPGDVIVIDAEGAGELACWGGSMSLRAKARGIEGVVAAGYIRDIDVIRASQFPVFCRGSVPRTGTPFFQTLGVNQPVQIGGKVVTAGDLIFADGDGVTIVPAARAEEVLTLAEQRGAKVEAGRVLARAGKSPFRS